MKKCIMVVLCLALLSGRGLAAPTPDHLTVRFQRSENMASSISWPMVEGLLDPTVQQAIQLALDERGGLAQYQALLQGMADVQATPLVVVSEANLLPAEQPLVLAVRIAASGRIGPGRPGHRVTAMAYELATGKALGMEDLFTDPALAQEQMELMIEQQVMPELSDYLDASGLLPVPTDNYYLNESGMTFYYPTEQMTFLSGQPASVSFLYSELTPWLKVEEGSALASLVNHATKLDQVGAKGLLALAAQGQLPGIPVKLHDDTAQVLAAFPPMADADAFPGGEKYLPEEGRFRDTALIVSTSEPSRIIGILSRRTNVFGLVTGLTVRADATALYGQPLASLPMDADLASLYGLQPGMLDVYGTGEHELVFCYNDTGILQALWLRSPQ